MYMVKRKQHHFCHGNDLASAFQVPQNFSNSNNAQSNEYQHSVMLFIAWGVEIIQYWFLR